MTKWEGEIGFIRLTPSIWDIGISLCGVELVSMLNSLIYIVEPIFQQLKLLGLVVLQHGIRALVLKGLEFKSICIWSIFVCLNFVWLSVCQSVSPHER